MKKRRFFKIICCFCLLLCSTFFLTACTGGGSGGTTIYVEGYGYYVVEDRGPRDGIIDIASPNHEACGPVTKRGVNVYIVPNE